MQTGKAAKPERPDKATRAEQQKAAVETPQEGHTPLYKRIKAEIQQRIAAAELTPGMPLPTRAALAAHYHTTRATIDRAMQELTRDGVVTGGSGRRTLVLGPGAQTARSIAVVWNAPEEHINTAGGDFFGPLNSGIRRACAEFMLEVHFRASQLASYAEVLADTGAQGLLVLRPDYSDVPALERLTEQGIPIVTVPGIMGAGRIASVSSDNFMGMEQAVDHLTGLGHREIGFVCLTGTVPDHFERLQGFHRAMGRRNLPLNPRRLYLTHALHADDFLPLCRDLLLPDDLPTAIIASDFLMGLAVLRRLTDLGLNVPRDVALMNFDDPPAASHLTPAMTVVKQHVPQLAYHGVQRLVQMIRSEEAPLVDRIPTELVIRESTLPPRS
jgi:DNA-binding LacI/PurR family transcriptional regulator